VKPAPYTKVPSTALVLVTLALAALLLARGINSVIAARLLPRRSPVVAFATARAAPLPGAASPDPCAILNRNIFDATSGALCPSKTPVSHEPPPLPPPPRPGELPLPCEGEARKLVAAVRSEHHPDGSFAEVSGANGKSLLLRPGERVDDQEVFAVYPRAVLLRQPSGHYCSLTFFADISSACTTPPCVPSPSPRRPLAPGELEAGITAAGETQFRVRRAIVDELLLDGPGMLPSLGVVPHEENDRLAGVKLYGIRRNGLWGKLGLHNGDLLRTVNGLDIASPDAALQAYAQLRSASQLSVSIERRGRPITLSYLIE
jgi:general secretion pathway protein C